MINDENLVIKEWAIPQLEDVKQFTDRWIGDNYFSLDQLGLIFEQSIKNGHSASMIAFFEEQIVGIRLSLAPGQWIDSNRKGLSRELWNIDSSKLALFQSLFIDERFQKKGVGSSLSLKSIKALSLMGAQAILCHSWLEAPNNSSQKYLKKMGFEKVREHPLFWYDIDYQCTLCSPKRCTCTALEMIKYLDV